MRDPIAEVGRKFSCTGNRNRLIKNFVKEERISAINRHY